MDVGADCRQLFRNDMPEDHPHADTTSEVVASREGRDTVLIENSYGIPFGQSVGWNGKRLGNLGEVTPLAIPDGNLHGR